MCCLPRAPKSGSSWAGRHARSGRKTQPPATEKGSAHRSAGSSTSAGLGRQHISPPLEQDVPVCFRPIDRHGFFLELVFLLYLLLGRAGSFLLKKSVYEFVLFN